MRALFAEFLAPLRQEFQVLQKAQHEFPSLVTASIEAAIQPLRLKQEENDLVLKSALKRLDDLEAAHLGHLLLFVFCRHPAGHCERH